MVVGDRLPLVEWLHSLGTKTVLHLQTRNLLQNHRGKSEILRFQVLQICLGMKMTMNKTKKYKQRQPHMPRKVSENYENFQNLTGRKKETLHSEVSQIFSKMT